MDADEPPKEKRNWLFTSVKVLLLLGAFLLVVFTVMANMGGNSDVLKKAIEDYISETTGYQTTVDTLNSMTFFPNISFDFEDMDLHASSEDTTPLVHVGRVQVVIGFFDVMMTSGKIKLFNIEDMTALPGVILDQALAVKKAAIFESENGGARIKAEGRVGKESLFLQIDMESFGTGENKKFRFGRQQQALLRLGKAGAEAILSSKGKGVSLEGLSFSLDEKSILNSDLHFYRDGRNSVKIAGQIELAERKTVFVPHLRIKLKEGRTIVTGEIISPEFYPDDFGLNSGLRAFVDYIGSITGNPSGKESEIDLSSVDLDLEVSIQKLFTGGVDIGHINLPVMLENAHLKIKPDGSFASGVLGGQIGLDATELPASLDINLALHRMDYGDLQRKFVKDAQITGVADIVVQSRASGRRMSELVSNLNGQATFIGGKGRFHSGAINIWGGGLINAIMPNVSPEKELGVNCAIMDFLIKDGIAKVDTLFVDGINVTLAGKGQYDIGKDKLDIFLKPKSKNVALIDVSNAVKITGPLSSPSFGPSLFDFGAKIGGLLLGVVNPAFLAFSLTDLGLNDNHPCAGFIQEDEQITEEKPEAAATP